MRGLEGSDGAEHVIVGAHRVVVHKQLASEGFVVEVAGEVAHRPFEVVAFLDDVAGEVFFAVKAYYQHYKKGKKRPGGAATDCPIRGYLWSEEEKIAPQGEFWAGGFDATVYFL